MRSLSSPDLATHDITRQRVYAVLLAEPGRNWTLAGMTERLPDVPVIEVRATLNMLLGDRLMDAEPVVRQRPLRVRLNSDGEQVLDAVLHGWESADRGEAASSALGGRNAQ